MVASDIVQDLLRKRGMTNSAEVERFLTPNFERDTHDPSLLLGMDRAVARIFEALTSKERIAVYTDFDCDGIPAAALLHDLFHKIEYTDISVYIPHRDREGYGFHVEAIDQLAKAGVSLIITADVGTTAVESVAYAKGKGIDVIVTDHHEIIGALPDAVAIINPKLSDYPFRDLCGAAVAYKLAQAILREGKHRSLPVFLKIPDGWEKWLLDMVAIATVADMVPLLGENRALAHFGLKVLRKSLRPGIHALVARLRLRQGELTEDDIGFSIAPRINAASRMGEPELAFRLLTTANREEADKLSKELESLNASRKGIVGSVVKEAKKRTRDRFPEHERIVVLGNPEWKPALLGLVANSLVEERGGVVCLWGRDANGRLKGSCRSDGTISVVALFEHAGDLFEESGGHEGSGGFSIAHERVHTLHEELSRIVQDLPAVQPKEMEDVDGVVTLVEMSKQFLKGLSVLAPFGLGNPKPIFRASGVWIERARMFGKSNDHIELVLRCPRSGASCRAFEFFALPGRFTHAPSEQASVDILFTLESDQFRGGIALRLVDVLPASC